MNHKTALASLALLTAFAGTTATLHAGTDVHINIGLGSVITRPLPPPVVVVDRNDRPRGYWKTITIKEWVPGRWVIDRDRRGRPVRTFEAGHYSYRDERVWVGGDRDRDRDDRGWNDDYRR
jgi:hypothetical protein